MSANASLRLRCAGTSWKREVLVPIPKEPGNPDREKIRPLKMQEVLRKSVLGVVMRRFMTRAVELGLVDEMQSGFVPGKDTSTPLLQLRAIVDNHNFFRKDLVLVSQDIKRAYDSCEYVSGKEMPLRRWGAPEELIELLKEYDDGRVTEIRIAQGSTADILGEELGTFHDQCGWGQGLSLIHI